MLRFAFFSSPLLMVLLWGRRSVPYGPPFRFVLLHLRPIFQEWARGRKWVNWAVPAKRGRASRDQVLSVSEPSTVASFIVHESKRKLYYALMVWTKSSNSDHGYVGFGPGRSWYLFQNAANLEQEPCAWGSCTVPKSFLKDYRSNLMQCCTWTPCMYDLLSLIILHHSRGLRLTSRRPPFPLFPKGWPSLSIIHGVVDLKNPERPQVVFAPTLVSLWSPTLRSAFRAPLTSRVHRIKAVFFPCNSRSLLAKNKWTRKCLN